MTIAKLKQLAGVAPEKKSKDKKADKKKALKCLQLVILFMRASKVQMKENPALVPEQAAALVKVLEPLID